MNVFAGNSCSWNDFSWGEKAQGREATLILSSGRWLSVQACYLTKVEYKVDRFANAIYSDQKSGRVWTRAMGRRFLENKGYPMVGDTN